MVVWSNGIGWLGGDAGVKFFWLHVFMGLNF
jgi:hypothetical protein